MSKIVDTMDQWLVSDWRTLHRMASMWLMSLNGLVVGAWALYPNEIREILTPLQIKVLLAFIVVSSMIARAIKQGKPENDDVQHSGLADGAFQPQSDADAADRLASGG